MPIGNLSNKVSEDDVARVRDIRNPPEHEPGFEPDSGGDFSDVFGDGGGSDFSFDDLMTSDFGSPSSSGGGDSGDIFGGSGGFGGSSFGGGGFGDSGFGGSSFGGGGFGQGGAQQPKEKQPDHLDKMIDSSGDAMASIGSILIEMFKSIKNRNADDFAYYSRNLIIIGASSIGASLIMGLIGAITEVRFLGFRGLTGQIFGSGMLSLGAGLTGIGFSAMKVAGMTADTSSSISELPDIAQTEPEDSTEDYEENVGDILDDLFGDESEDLFGEDTESNHEEEEEEEDMFKPDLDNISYTSEELDFSKQLDEIKENQYISRELLFNTFKPFFPVNTPNFADKTELDRDSEDFQKLETICLKALANVAKCEMEDVKSKLESASDSYFSYELRLKRIRGVNKTEEIAREMEVYFRSSSTDTSVTASVDIEGDFYKVVVAKGVTAVVTFGDMFRQQYVCDFFLNTKNKLPVIAGVTELGEVILEDAKIFDTMLIAGKPRSGKSWYVLSILLALMMFNSPEEVQFVLVDPKETDLFNTLSLMPHSCGLHNDKDILEIMDDIIENEGARRKRILADNRCDDIWALWKKGIKLPILYLVIDEYITVRNNLGALSKELDSKLQTIITQLPSQGIRILIVPHRSTGVVDKTNRTMISFSAAVRSNLADAADTLDLKSWKRPLTNPGDIAIKSSNMNDGMYVRGGAITTDDDDNKELIINVAKAFYKMGVDIPDMTSLHIACNRNEDKIKEELTGDGNRVQYNADNVFDDME